MGASDDFNFGSGDFTIDWWQYLTDITGTTVSAESSDGNYLFALNYRTGSEYTTPDLAFYASSAGNSVWDVASSVKMGTIRKDIWVHYAVCRRGNTIYLFENGILQNKVNVTGRSFVSATKVNIGRYRNLYCKGYIDEFRISKGIARWTDNFTPPTEPYEGGTPTIPAPTNLTATAGDAKVTLNWNAVTDATGYNVKRSTTAGGPYTTIASNVSGISYVNSGLTNGTTYYYVVTAITANGESGPSNEASATPKANTTPGDNEQSLLRVIMIDSSEREYWLSKSEIDGFVNWYNHHVAADAMSYAINDSVDLSKEYLSFDKIISFKVVSVVNK